jgi:hypothetical protein
MEDLVVVANTHLQAYLVLPTKRQQKERVLHVILENNSMGVDSNSSTSNSKL